MQWCRFFFHANLDRLVELTAKFDRADPDAAAENQHEFTAILQDIRVNDVWKFTSKGRLPETEKAVLRFLETYRPRPGDPGAPVQILDVGASDGSTTVDLLQAIRKNGNYNVEITTTDLCNALYRYRKGIVTEYRSSGGHPVLVRIGRLGLRLPDSEYEWNWPATALARWYLSLGGLRAAMTEDLRISLINPSAERDPDIRIEELDCLELRPSLVGRFDLVRASNIITPRYGFEGEKLQRALKNIHAYLRNGGGLIISRNQRHSEIEHGSTWKKGEQGFIHVGDFGSGSEIRTAVTNFVAHATRGVVSNFS